MEYEKVLNPKEGRRRGTEGQRTDGEIRKQIPRWQIKPNTSIIELNVNELINT